MKTLDKPKTVIVHDWLVGGGAERVVLELHRMFPDAPIYTSYCTDEWRHKLDGKVITGYLQHWPFSALRKFLPVLRQRWFKHLDLSDFNLIISSSGNGEAKFVRKPNGAKHICYCHTPPHFYWEKYDEYLREPGFRPKWLVRFGLKLLVSPLRKRDYRAAQNVDVFIANSSHIQTNIHRFYERESQVVHPPVDTQRFKPLGKNRQGFITVGRQVPYKRTDIIIEACQRAGLHVKIAGTGPEYAELSEQADKTVQFLGFVGESELAELLAEAQAFLFAASEDFGVAPVEALAAGTPVIAYRAGGALDYVKEGETGLFFDEQTPESLVGALQEFAKKKFDEKVVAASAERFSPRYFREGIQRIIDSTLVQ